MNLNKYVCKILNFMSLVYFTNALSKDSVSYSLELHPQGLTCTIYMKLMSPRDKDEYSKVIEDNRLHFIMCLNTDGINNTVPDPSINFLEQCAINILVGREYAAEYIWQSAHEYRSQKFSTFIVVSTNWCQFAWTAGNLLSRTVVFYYFPSCPYTFRSLFPNAYLNYYEHFRSSRRINGLATREDYSIYSEKPPISSIKYPNYLVHDIWNFGEAEIINQKCRKFVNLKTVSTSETFCNQHEWFAYVLQTHFNLSVTGNLSFLENPGGFYIPNLVLSTEPLKHFLKAASDMVILDSFTAKLLYCLPQQSQSLLTFEALSSPFPNSIWISSLVCGIMLIFTPFVRQFHGTYFSIVRSNCLTFLRLLLDQNVNRVTLCMLVTSYGIFNLTTMYRMIVTSSLLVKSPTKPMKDVNQLFDSGYILMYDTSKPVLLEALQRNNLPNSNSSVLFSNEQLVDFTSNVLSLICGKVVWATVFSHWEKDFKLEVLEYLLQNMSCFVFDKYLEKTWKSYTFYHPLSHELIRVTKAVNEAGIFSLFDTVYVNHLNLRNYNKFKPSVKKLREKELTQNSFIHLADASTIFVTFFVCNLVYTFVFFINCYLKSQNRGLKLWIFVSLALQNVVEGVFQIFFYLKRLAFLLKKKIS